VTLASHLAKDVRLSLRDWRSLVVALAVPPVILFAYARLDLHDFVTSGRSADAFILVLSATFPLLLVASGVIVQERRLGTLQRLARSPANLFAFFVSKLLAAALLLVAQVVVILLAAWLLVPTAAPAVAAHPMELGALLLLSGLGSYALGLLVSAAVGTEAQASQVTAMALLLMLTLSGFLQPLSDAGALGAVAAYSPVALGYAGGKALLDQARGAGEPVALLSVTVGLVLVAALVTALRARRA
jgi:ABC-type transport system involved in multi-copper enzyme maturation permease subunit